MRDSILIALGRDYLVRNLANCTEKQINKFKSMYGRKYGQRSLEQALSMTIKDVVDEIPENKIEWAMQQVEVTLQLNAKNDGAVTS